jgi:carbon monoxide dehydrogenase subunit G
MKVFASSTMIQATPQAVWTGLTDGTQWARWNPTVDKVDAKSIPDTQPAFDQFAAALNRRCEQDV